MYMYSDVISKFINNNNVFCVCEVAIGNLLKKGLISETFVIQMMAMVNTIEFNEHDAFCMYKLQCIIVSRHSIHFRWEYE